MKGEKPKRSKRAERKKMNKPIEIIIDCPTCSGVFDQLLAFAAQEFRNGKIAGKLDHTGWVFTAKGRRWLFDYLVGKDCVETKRFNYEGLKHPGKDVSTPCPRCGGEGIIRLREVR